MPIHDWTTVDAGLFHHFHQNWTVALCGDLNADALRSDHFALVEQMIPGSIPDVLTLKVAERAQRPQAGSTDLGPGDRAPESTIGVAHRSRCLCPQGEPDHDSTSAWRCRCGGRN